MLSAASVRWTRHLFTTKDLDLLVLKLIFAHVMRFSRPQRIQLVPGTADMVMVRSSIKSLTGGCLMPDFVFGPQHSTSADLVTMFTAGATRVAEMVHDSFFKPDPV